MKVLVTGGAGYIGSHACVELLATGHDVVVVDNLSNSKPVALERVQALAGRSLDWVEADLRDRAAIEQLFASRSFDAVLHFAGLKAVGESTERPLDYHDNNVGGTLALCQAMAAAGVKRIVFSSSATVYGDPDRVPITEDAALSVASPYGRTKLMVEDILRDLHQADPSWSVALLRYFNPVGAHPSGRIGEDPNGIPNNLMPYATQVAIGRLPWLRVFGGDWPTPDGTGVRDYIHVVDLARGHLAALQYLQREPGLLTCNLGTGRGYSVLDVVHAFERVRGEPLPYRIIERRPGDIATCYADPSLARDLLGWHAERDLDAMVADAWNWQRSNPDGYD